jgi:hypothetical protein
MPKILNILERLLLRMPAPFHRIPAELRQKDLREKVQQRFTKGDSEPCSQPKVFGIGLSKTGTTSLAAALEVLGYTSLSWKRDGKVLGWPEFYYADAATDTVCSAQFESLYHTFEESKFIYTVRDIDDWEQSIIRHFGNYFGVDKPSDFRCLHRRKSSWEDDPGWEFHNSLRTIQIRECLYAHHSSWRDAYWAFDQRVRHFFEDKPDDRFVKMNIPDGDGWDLLCSLLDREVPDRPFPHRRLDPS